MTDRLQVLLDMRDSFNKDFPGIAEKNRDVYGVVRNIMFEAAEMCEAISLGEPVEEIADEGADIFWFLVAAFDELGVDLFEAARQKHAYNLLRFGGLFKEPGSYEQDYPAAKRAEKLYQLKKGFRDGETVES